MGLRNVTVFQAAVWSQLNLECATYDIYWMTVHSHEVIERDILFDITN